VPRNRSASPSRPEFHDFSPESFYQPVFDYRNRRVPGLVHRGGIFYGRVYLRLTDGRYRDRLVRLNSASLIEARRELSEIRANRQQPASNKATTPERTPVGCLVPEHVTLATLAPRYLERAKLTKRPSTAKIEGVHLGHFLRSDLGNISLRNLAKADALAYRDRQLKAGWSARTANLALTVLRNALQCARDEGLIEHDPLHGIRPLRHVPRKRPLFATGRIEHLAAVAEATCPRSGKTLADFLRVCAYAGPRCSEAMRLKWSDVDWDRRQLVIGTDGLTKNHEARAVDFNPRLAEVLESMRSRRSDGAQFLFSPTRKPGQHCVTMRQTLEVAREHAGMPDFGFHDYRHHFVSYCVMSGIDFLTIARWVGHKDGGILIGKVYGHLSHEHLKSAAQRLRFETSADSGGMSQ
jgi:integrase